ncbi:hypothetical protein TSUD_16150 [Trifolium subterraneum]|uniref:WRKY domain-containing protein n=1 Tax=Trifolium subterraneum TaxID=3900 RepID=A0A2Z6NVE2_TRISU|nr:hypothetical protein TSUD_16150 [Trifolium subterraneum]
MEQDDDKNNSNENNKNKIGDGEIFGANSKAQSARLTIPPGISPTALLESPIMLPNSMAMPSPTTGSFAMLQPLTDERSMLTSVTHEQRKLDVPTASNIAASFKFKPQANLNPNSLSPCYDSLNQVSSNCQMMTQGHRDNQMLFQDQQLLDFSFSEDFSNDNSARNNGLHFYNDVKMIDDVIIDGNNVDMPIISCSEETSDESTLPENSINDDDIAGQQLDFEDELKEMTHATGAKTSEDGYNWRKYGQKQVKGSEYPRSYYKCTQTNCQVKKKVERSHDGHITEIIYRGNHNHAKPHSNRRGSTPSNDEISDIAEINETSDRADADSISGNIQLPGKDGNHIIEWKPDGQERTRLPSTMTEHLDSTKRFRSLGMLESNNALEHSSAHANHDGDRDGATQEVLPLRAGGAEEAESESKRRKNESYPVETMVPSRAIREPRVVVQVESEVDILDDGYRWRKYGQKVVKGNPNPRSYYKCTTTGCNVRKHVERASHNLKYILTTYEGKHNHDVPTARNNNHISANDVALASSRANVHASGIPKSETHQTLAPHFDRKPDFANEFLRSSLMGSFSNDMNFGPSSISQMNYSSLNSVIPFGAYGTNHDHGVAPQAGPIASIFPEFPMPLPMNLPSSGNFSLPGINFNYAQPMNSIQSYLSGQLVMDIDAGFLRPKQEPKDESLYLTCTPSLDHASSSLAPPSTSSSQSIYQSAMQNFP